MANIIEFKIIGIDKFSGAMKRVATAIQTMAKKLISFAKWAAAGTAALTAFAGVVNSGIDKVGKFSTRIGVAVDQLSRMQFVANQAGISSEQFNMAVQRMTRRVSEAAKGMGEAQGALVELGIDAKSFAQLGLDEQMATLSDKMAGTTNQSDRLRLAFKLFDSEGTAVLQMLNQGSGAMQDMAKDAQFLGLVISKQAAAQAALLSDAMGRATGSLKGLSRGIVGDLSPLLTGIANKFADFIATNREGIISFVRNTTVNFFTFIEVVKQVYTTFKEIFSGNTEVLAGFLDGVIEFVKQMGILFFDVGKIIFKGIWEGLKAATRITTEFGTWLGETIYNLTHGKDVESFGDAMADSLVRNLGQARDEILSGIQGDTQALKDAFDSAGTAITSGLGINMEEARNNAQLLMQSLSQYAATVRDEMQTTGDSMTEWMTLWQDRQKTFMQELRDSSKSYIDSFFNLMSSTIDNISNAIGQAIVNGENLAESFKSIAKQVLASLISMLVKMGIQRLLLSAITGSAAASEAAQEGGKAVGLAGANGVASMAGAPFPINLGAPAFGAAMAATAAGQLAAGIATGAGIGGALKGIAHGGMTNVPREATYLLDKGERVLSPNQNSDLTSFMNSGGSGGTVIIESITFSILENATNADALLNMDRVKMEEIVAGPIIAALNRLDKKGVRPVFSERGNR